MIVIETQRLLLRAFTHDDLDAVAAMTADPEVMRYLGDGRTIDRADAWRQMAMFMGHWALRGYGVWALEERASGAFVGRAGLFYPDGWPAPELIWALARPHWGKGYATEATHAALDHAFGSLGWERAISLIRPDNARSVRVAERLGETLEGRVEFRGLEALVYSVTRHAWQARRGGRA